MYDDRFGLYNPYTIYICGVYQNEDLARKTNVGFLKTPIANRRQRVKKRASCFSGLFFKEQANCGQKIATTRTNYRKALHIHCLIQLGKNTAPTQCSQGPDTIVQDESDTTCYILQPLILCQSDNFHYTNMMPDRCLRQGILSIPF